MKSTCFLIQIRIKLSINILMGKCMILNKLIQKLKGKRDISSKDKEEMVNNLNKLKNQKVNIMIIGGTGVGKSSTINALFKGNVAKVGINPAPETMEITKFKIDDDITIWDSPGLGDGIRDKGHKEKIIKLLHRTDEEENNFIDCVLVIVSASSKDLGTEFELINKILIPNLGEEVSERIIVAINKADEAISPRYWDNKNNCPSEEQRKFLEEKVIDIQNRIYESTGVDIKPIYYTAGYSDEKYNDPSYKIDELMIFILNHTPPKKAIQIGEGFDDDNRTDDVIDVIIDRIGKVFGGIGDFFSSWFK